MIGFGPAMNAGSITGRSDSEMIRIRRFASVIEEFRRDPMLQTLPPGFAVAWLRQMDAGVNLPASQESMTMAAEVLAGLCVFRQTLKHILFIAVPIALAGVVGIFFGFGEITENYGADHGCRSGTATTRRGEGYGKPIVAGRVTVRVTGRANR